MRSKHSWVAPTVTCALLACGETATIPTAETLFSPEPGTNFETSTGVVQVDVDRLDDNPACVTIDGEVPGIDGDDECTGSSTPVSKSITLRCNGDVNPRTIRQIKLAFTWPEHGELHVSASYSLDCSSGRGNDDAGAPPKSVDGGGGPQGNPGQSTNPWVNDEMARAVTRTLDQIRCDIRCTDPTSGGKVGSIDCEGGGTATWSVDVDILGGTADSTFTYDHCSYVSDEGDHLTIDGELFQASSFAGDGEERGTLKVNGDFEGVYTSNHVFHDHERDGGFVTVSCTEHSRSDLAGEVCAPNNLETQHPFPDYECSGIGCP